jgi:hypothetical protein
MRATRNAELQICSETARPGIRRIGESRRLLGGGPAEERALSRPPAEQVKWQQLLYKKRQQHCAGGIGESAKVALLLSVSVGRSGAWIMDKQSYNLVVVPDT